jgi:transposase
MADRAWALADRRLPGREVSQALSRFPSAKRLTSWAKLCPGHSESRGTRKSGKSSKGSRWRRQLFNETTHGAPSPSGHISARCPASWRSHRGRRRVLVAVGHTIVVIADHVLARQEPYQDCGADDVTSRDRRRVQRRLVRRLEQPGDQVSLRPASTAMVAIFSEPYLSHPCDLPPPRRTRVDATQPRHRR